MIYSLYTLSLYKCRKKPQFLPAYDSIWRGYIFAVIRCFLGNKFLLSMINFCETFSVNLQHILESIYVKKYSATIKFNIRQN